MRVIAITSDEELAEALAVRFEVFVEEQGVSPDAERDSIATLAVSPDGIEGVDAFVAKRTPRFGDA